MKSKSKIYFISLVGIFIMLSTIWAWSKGLDKADQIFQVKKGSYLNDFKELKGTRKKINTGNLNESIYEINMNPGEKYRIPEIDKECEWKSSDESVAFIGKLGDKKYIVSLRPGDIYITGIVNNKEICRYVLSVNEVKNMPYELREMIARVAYFRTFNNS